MSHHPSTPFRAWLLAAAVGFAANAQPAHAQFPPVRYRDPIPPRCVQSLRDVVCEGDSILDLRTGDGGIVTWIDVRRREVEYRSADGRLCTADLADVEVRAGRRPPGNRPQPRPRPPYPEPQPRPPYPGDCVRGTGGFICYGDVVEHLQARSGDGRRCRGDVVGLDPRYNTVNVQWRAPCSGYGANLDPRDLQSVRSPGTPGDCVSRDDGRFICAGDLVRYLPNGAEGTVLDVNPRRQAATVSWNRRGSGVGVDLDVNLLMPISGF